VEVEKDAAVTLLRHAIATAFPSAVLFQGAVTPADDEQWAEEIDEDLDLRDNLKGRAWKDVPDEIIDRNAGGLPLLTPAAFAAFLPAWLMRSLDRLDDENEVRELTVYQFCRSGSPSLAQPAQSYLEAYQLTRFKELSAAQLIVVREFLSLVSTHEHSGYLREKAQEALLNLEAVR
jgi:hypothetical protein